MKTTTTIGILSMIITLSLTSCYWSTTRTTNPTPQTMTTVTQQSKTTTKAPVTTTTTRSTTY